MSDLKLFRLASNSATEVLGTGLALEKSLQTLIEQNLETFLGVRFLASEFSTGSEHGGRMDTRDVRKIGHFGTGDLEVTIRSFSDMEKAKPFIEQSYESA